MDEPDLQLDSNLQKDTSGLIQSQGAVYQAANPSTPANSPSNYTQPGGAPDILTATVILSCFIQTSALPYRAQLQDNDLTFFDDTTTQGDTVIGHTSRLIFTHNSGIQGTTVTQGFIWEKRASTIDSYDNVLSLYALPAINDPVSHANTMNYLFFGLQGSLADPEYNVNVVEFVVVHDDNTVTKPSQNGEFNIAGSSNGAEPVGLNFAVQHNSLLGVPGEGFSVYIAGTGTGIVEIGGSGLVIAGELDVNGNILPETDATFDLGSAMLRWRNLYLSGTFSVGTLSATSISAGTIGATSVSATTISAGTFELPGGILWTFGSGTPNSYVTAPVGSLYSNTAGGSGNTLWVKESGTGNTGWVAK